jgi:type I restriction enzyme M protein
LLADLDYRDSQIKTKQSISELTVSLGGAKSVRYKPDYVLTYRKKARWVIDAKNPDEELGKWVAQCGGYCLGLNKTFRGENPVKWFILTNGYETRVYAWDEDEPLLTLDFADFASGKPKYEQLRALLAAQSIAESHPAESATFKLERPTPQQAKGLFALCHRAIRKTGEGYSGAFIQFMKLMFVKLWCDRQLREDEATKAMLAGPGPAYLPKDAVAFSTHWIEKETLTASPVNDILFKRLRDEIEEDIARKKKNASSMQTKKSIWTRTLSSWWLENSSIGICSELMKT